MKGCCTFTSQISFLFWGAENETQKWDYGTCSFGNKRKREIQTIRWCDECATKKKRVKRNDRGVLVLIFREECRKGGKRGRNFADFSGFF